MDPARIFTESLTPRPELENSLGQAAVHRVAAIRLQLEHKPT
jgi:hypothetical protein